MAAAERGLLESLRRLDRRICNHHMSRNFVNRIHSREIRPISLPPIPKPARPRFAASVNNLQAVSSSMRSLTTPDVAPAATTTCRRRCRRRCCPAPYLEARCTTCCLTH